MINQDSAGFLKSLERGESLPALFYTSAEIEALERTEIFRRTWQYIGPKQKLTQTGDYITGYAGDIPVVVLRNNEGLQGFINVCRHRRHEVMQGCGNAKIMQCGYHAWTYDLNGCLKAAPRADREPDFCLDDYPLLSLKVDTLGPWIFVNPDPTGEPLDKWYGPVLQLIEESGLDLNSLELFSREDWQSQSNWKTMLENYLECYHCPVAHPGFSAAIDVDQDSYQLTARQWCLSQVGQVRQSALEGDTKVKIYDARGSVRQAQYHLLWPNFTININPGFPNLSVDVWLPDGPCAAKGFSEQYFGPGVDKSWAQELVAFNKQVGDEDDVLTESVQRGLIGGLPEKGRFLVKSERLIVEFQKLIVQALVRQSPGY